MFFENDVHRFATVASEMDPEDADKFRREIDKWPEDPEKHMELARDFASLISLSSLGVENKEDCELSEEHYKDVERWDLVSPGEYRALVAYEIAKTQQKQHEEVVETLEEDKKYLARWNYHSFMRYRLFFKLHYKLFENGTLQSVKLEILHSPYLPT